MKKAKKFTYDISQKKLVEVIYPKKEYLLEPKYSRKFSCEFCEAEYSSKIKLKRHLAWVHEEKQKEEHTEKKEKGNKNEKSLELIEDYENSDFEKSLELIEDCENSDDEIQVIGNFGQTENSRKSEMKGQDKQPNPVKNSKNEDKND